MEGTWVAEGFLGQWISLDCPPPCFSSRENLWVAETTLTSHLTLVAALLYLLSNTQDSCPQPLKFLFASFFFTYPRDLYVASTFAHCCPRHCGHCREQDNQAPVLTDFSSRAGDTV